MKIFKALVNGVSLTSAFLPAALCGFGRIEFLFHTLAHAYALAPGLIGDYFRMGFYRLML